MMTSSTVLTFSVVHQQPLLGENAPYALLFFSCALGGYFIVTELLLPLNHNCWVVFSLTWSLNNDDGDVNKNGIKAIGLDW